MCLCKGSVPLYMPRRDVVREDPGFEVRYIRNTHHNIAVLFFPHPSSPGTHIQIDNAS